MNYATWKKQLSKPEILSILDQGTIVTPFELIEDIVDKLPIMWDNPNMKFLDPCCGRGAFLFVIKHRLMEFHSEQHIVENMLYGVDISGKSVAFTKTVLNPENKYTDNIECNDSLTKEWNMKFDVVIGNPPYQDSTASSTSNSSLWVDFSLAATKWVNEGGWIALVTPQSWMKPNHKLLKWFKSHHMSFVNTNIKHYFPGVGSTFCYWIASPDVVDKVTTVDAVDVDLRTAPYVVPGELLSIHSKVVFNTATKFVVASDQQTAYTLKLTRGSPDLSKVKTDTCMYPIFHTNAQTLYCANKTKNFDDAKVMFSDSGYFRPRYDAGMTGSSQRCYYILVTNESEGTVLVDVLSSRLYQFIVNTAKWSGFSDLTVLRSLPAVDLTRSWTDGELYEHFNLTPEEIKLIEETVK